MINNPRTSNIIEAAADVSSKQKALTQRETWHKKHVKSYEASCADIQKCKDNLNYALRRLDEATRL